MAPRRVNFLQAALITYWIWKWLISRVICLRINRNSNTSDGLTRNNRGITYMAACSTVWSPWTFRFNCISLPAVTCFWKRRLCHKKWCSAFSATVQKKLRVNESYLNTFPIHIIKRRYLTRSTLPHFIHKSSYPGVCLTFIAFERVTCATYLILLHITTLTYKLKGKTCEALEYTILIYSPVTSSFLGPSNLLLLFLNVSYCSPVSLLFQSQCPQLTSLRLI
jgi:hypothetical protein